jgi:ribosomal-protein-alanine N-acetyltransferase
MERAPVPVPVLETERLVLTMLSPGDEDRVVAYFTANRAHLEPWDPARPAGFYTPAYWRSVLAHSLTEHAAGTACKLFVFDRSAGGTDGPVIGTANLSQIVRGAFMSCMLGYGLDHRYVGRGVMTEALGAVIHHAFGTLRLHRIQANHVPTNERSAATLRRLGFVVEGYARDYLHIGGRWRDHVLTALLNPEDPLEPRS